MGESKKQKGKKENGGGNPGQEGPPDLESPLAPPAPVTAAPAPAALPSSISSVDEGEGGDLSESFRVLEQGALGFFSGSEHGDHV